MKLFLQQTYSVKDVDSVNPVRTQLHINIKLIKILVLNGNFNRHKFVFLHVSPLCKEQELYSIFHKESICKFSYIQ